MQNINIVFFGSTTDSLIVLKKIYDLPSTIYDLRVTALVTQPPRPVGRKHVITPTPIEVWGKEHTIPVLSFLSNPEQPNLYADEASVVNALATFKADLLISASYGQKIPTETIEKAKHGGLNVHPSILPRWRGADPVPWAILSGDHQIGVSVVTLTEKFDEGKIIAQKKIPITPKDFSDPLRAHLFALGADLLVESLPDYLSGKNKGVIQDKTGTPYAKRFTREDGFEPWEHIQKSFADKAEALRIDRKLHALTPWPGLWTKVTIYGEEKRLKILEASLENDILVLTLVQLEGKTPVAWKQFLSTYPQFTLPKSS